MPSSLLDRLLAPAPKPSRVAWLAQQEYAHRGLHDDGRIENSRSAFAAAIERGLGIECDVQRTADREVVVFHDWTLERLTGAAGETAKYSAKVLAAMPLKGSNDTIQTLAAFLDQVAGQVPVLVEIKSKDDRRVVTPCMAVRRALEGYRGKAAVMSFDPRVCRWFAAHAPHIVRGLVVTEEGHRTLMGRLRRHLALWHARPDFLAYDVRDLPSRFAESQWRRGLPLLSWTVKTPELRRAALDAGATPIAEAQGF
ncbi:glycerophosphodiester phosphodiesterase family protein [Alteriqipengyuania sp. WL0013]|uniref:glycerophosphodiester phosphodiesterase family protein n=1 Tax=Alteriqipengyuania sp. WL0013 TaxID=3110773 RepID=UPI002BF8E498|nr:glycerophosphodiester phosphodiesterase family protein [Alteriqipengyuania sp. WL0013]MEB3416181.1 glycerophosphodiester phosphodiesterase family protein [Alteriqipengyuania sp. WL0013]